MLERAALRPDRQLEIAGIGRRLRQVVVALAELEPFAGLGLGDVEMDAALTYLLSFVQTATIAAQEAERQVGESGLDDTGWWRQVGPLLGRFLTADAYPLAARVGTAAGKQHGSAHDPESAYSFGIERVLDGLGALVEARSG